MNPKRKKLMIILIAALLVAALGVGLFFVISGVVAVKKQEERARLVKEYVDNKLKTYAEENVNHPDWEVIFLGDSLTDGCDVPKYYAGYAASNRGIGGDTSYGLLDRMQVSAYDANPKVIVLLIGGNDVLGGKSLDSIYANYQSIITGIRHNLPDTTILWCSQTVLGREWARHNDTIKTCNQTIRRLAQEYDVTYIDLFTPLCDPKTGEIREEYTVEGVHLTDAGYLVVSAEIKERLQAVLGH